MKMMTKWILIIWILSVGAIAASAQTADCAKVQPGDGFLRIAQRCNVKSNDLIAANKNAAWFKNDNFVPRNVTLTLPSQSGVVTQAQVAQGDAQKDAQITQLQNEVNSLKQQIAQLTKTKGSGDLTKQVADLTKQLEAAKKVTATGSPVVTADLEKELVRTKAELQGFKDNADLMFLMNPLCWIAGVIIILITMLAMWLWARKAYGMNNASHSIFSKGDEEIPMLIQPTREFKAVILAKEDYRLPVTLSEVGTIGEAYVNRADRIHLQELYATIEAIREQLKLDLADARKIRWNWKEVYCIQNQQKIYRVASQWIKSALMRPAAPTANTQKTSMAAA